MPIFLKNTTKSIFRFNNSDILFPTLPGQPVSRSDYANNGMAAFRRTDLLLTGLSWRVRESSLISNL
jgi:hypothetical protein